MTAMRVAIVDDDPLALDVIGAILQAEGFRVQAYQDGYDFLANVEQMNPDCVLLDVFMPECSGIDVLTLLQGLRYRGPVIMISARSDIPTAAAAMEAGAYDFVEKPIAPYELLDRVHEALRSFGKKGGG
jgi:FixJ family two-component response regulator